MTIWALSDPHLAFGAPDKSMEFFGPSWKRYAERMKENWEKVVSEEDLVLVPGDISWALKLEDALVDLNWIDALPGTKLILKGNHDYWWPSSAKLKKALPPSIHFIHNNTFTWNSIAFGGSRLWDTEEYSFEAFITFQENPRAREITHHEEANEENRKIFERELKRLELSLGMLDPNAKTRIALTHYPPIGADLADSRASQILEKYGVSTCIFGHLHSVKPGSLPFGEKNGVRYLFTSCDYLDFKPLKVLQL